jgi:hypothetical protein
MGWWEGDGAGQPRILSAGVLAPQRLGAALLLGAAEPGPGGRAGLLGPAGDGRWGRAGADGAHRQFTAIGQQADGGLVGAQVGQVVGAKLGVDVALEGPGVLGGAGEVDLGPRIRRQRVM